MDENTPRDSRQPDFRPADDAVGANDPTPRDAAPPADASADTARIDQQAATAAPARGRGVLKPVLIGSAAALTVLAIAGVGMTIADAVGDGDAAPSAPSASSAPLASAPAPTDGPSPSAPTDDSDGRTDDHGGQRGDDHGDDHGDDGRGGSGHGAGAGAAPSAAPDLVTAIDRAIAAAGGGSATSIEVEHGGWKVDVRLDDGSELDVRVPVSGDAMVREDDDDDRSSDLPLDTSRIADIVDAAVAAAGGGSVTAIESEDDAERFEVEVALGGDEVDVVLADDLAVLSSER